jgi:hypothetical protein
VVLNQPQTRELGGFNRQEGLGPEVDYYIADWIEARTLSEQPKALVFVLANDSWHNPDEH